MARVSQQRKITYLVDHLQYHLSKIIAGEVDNDSYGVPQVFTTFPLSQYLGNSTTSHVELTNLIVNEFAGLTTRIDTKSKELWWCVKDNLNLEHPQTSDIFFALLKAIKENQYLDHLMFAVLSNSIRLLVENKQNEIPKCLEFVKTQFGLLPKRPEYLWWDYNGKMKILRNKPLKFEHCCPDEIFFDERLLKNAATVMCAGPELEGGFPSQQDALAFVFEAQAEGLLTKADEFCPTSDGSIRNVGYSIEWNLAPAEFNADRIQWLRRFQDLLKKHHWSSSTEDNNSGLHIHIDRRILSTDQWLTVCDVFEQLTADAKANFFGRDARKRYFGSDGDYWCRWNRNVWYSLKKDYVLCGKDASGSEIFKLDKFLGAGQKYALINFCHRNTVEFRGFNSNSDLVKAHLGLYFVIVSVKAGKSINWIVDQFTTIYGKAA